LLLLLALLLLLLLLLLGGLLLGDGGCLGARSRGEGPAAAPSADRLEGRGLQEAGPKQLRPAGGSLQAARGDRCDHLWGR
jgi:hypothetical protein